MEKKEIDDLGTEKMTIYKNNFRKIYLKNRKNKSNYYTIIKEVLCEENYYITSKLEIGEKYVSYFKFDDKQNIIFERRFNKEKKTIFKKEIFTKNEKGEIVITEYQNQKNINFKLNK